VRTGRSYGIEKEYDEYLKTHHTETWDGKTYPSLKKDIDVCDVILNFASVTNGELAYRSYQGMEEKTGLRWLIWAKRIVASVRLTRIFKASLGDSSTVRCGRAD
jgi:nitrate reductase alpha subunit